MNSGRARLRSRHADLTILMPFLEADAPVIGHHSIDGPDTPTTPASSTATVNPPTSAHEFNLRAATEKAPPWVRAASRLPSLARSDRVDPAPTNASSIAASAMTQTACGPPSSAGRRGAPAWRERRRRTGPPPTLQRSSRSHRQASQHRPIEGGRRLQNRKRTPASTWW